jgi:serine/threonine protein kinase
MTVPIVPGTVIQDRYYVLRVVRPLEFGWLYSVADRQPSRSKLATTAHPLTCFLEEYVLPNSPSHPSLLERQLTTELTQLQQGFEHSSIHNSQFQTDLPDYGDVLLDDDRVWISQWYGDHFSYAQVLEDRALSGEGDAVLSEPEAWELLDALEPLLTALHRQGLSHGNLSPDSIVWQMATQKPGLMQFGNLRSVLQEAQARSIHPLDYVRSVHDCPIQADWVNLAEAVLILLGDPSWNRLSLQLAQRLRPLLETPPQSKLSKKTKNTRLKSIVAPAIPAHFPPSTATAIIGSPSPSAPNSSKSSKLSKQPQRAEQSSRSQHPKSSRRRRSSPSDGQSSMPSFRQDPILWGMGLVIFGLSMVFAYRLAYRLLPIQTQSPNAAPSSGPLAVPNSIPSGSAASFPLTTAPQSPELPPELQTQLRSLQLSEAWFVGTTAELLKNESIATDDSRWKETSSNLLKVLEPMTPEVRQGLGNYRRSDFESWLSAKNSPPKPDFSKQIETQTDQQFFEKFPALKGQPLNPRQLGQVWYAIAREVIKNQKT